MMTTLPVSEGRVRRKRSSRSGFELALQWLKGHLKLDVEGHVVAPEQVVERKTRVRASRKSGERCARATVKVVGVGRFHEEVRPEVDKVVSTELTEAPKHVSRRIERKVAGHYQLACTWCGKGHNLQRHLEKHEAVCTRQRPWDGVEVCRCTVCGVDYDDGQEMVECDRCHIWEHTRCHEIVNLESRWFCKVCSSEVAEASQLHGEQDPDNLSICEECQRGDDPGHLFLCDSCNRGFHTYCMPSGMSHPLPTDDAWFCSWRCANNIKRFMEILRAEVLADNERSGASCADRLAGEVEVLDFISPPKMWASAQKILVDAFGVTKDGHGMDREYVISSLRSQKSDEWDNSLHRTLVLHVNSKVFSVCTFRVLGDNEVAELIFAATVASKRKVGLFHRLHDLLVRALVRAGVNYLVIHATSSSEMHFKKYSRNESMTRRGEALLNYVPLCKDVPEHRRLFPRLLEMGSRLIITDLRVHF